MFTLIMNILSILLSILTLFGVVMGITYRKKEKYQTPFTRFVHSSLDAMNHDHKYNQLSSNSSVEKIN